MKKTTLIALLTAFLTHSTFTTAQTSPEKRNSVALEHGAHRLGKRSDTFMETWRNYGLGQFIHWGVYAIPGGHWDGNTIPVLPSGYAPGRKCPRMPTTTFTSSSIPRHLMPGNGRIRQRIWGQST